MSEKKKWQLLIIQKHLKKDFIIFGRKRAILHLKQITQKVLYYSDPSKYHRKLHLGHALDDTIQDIIIRTKRMQGYNTLWVPGEDHASIATEVKVEKELLKDGIVKKKIGREAFLEKTWEWTDEYRARIREQIKKLGCSVDFTRERFTMDEGLNKAVRKFCKII